MKLYIKIKQTMLTAALIATVATAMPVTTQALVGQGVITGYPDSSFQSQGVLKRSEVVFIIDRKTSDLVNDKGRYSQDIEGNLVVNTSEVVLENMTITGNLYLAEDIADGGVSLNNVTVLGDVIVEGGGVNTIQFRGKSVINNVVVKKTGAGEVKIIGNVKINQMTISEPVEINMAKNIVVQDVLITADANETVITGKGEITGEVRVEADGVEIKVTVDKKNIIIGEQVTENPVIPPRSTGGGGSGAASREKVQIQSIEVDTGAGSSKIFEVEGMVEVKVDEDGIGIEKGFLGKDERIYSVTINSNAPTFDISYGGVSIYTTTLQSGKAYTPAMLKAEIEKKDLGRYATTVISTYGKIGLKPVQVALALEKFDVFYSKTMERLNQTSISVGAILDKAKEAEQVLESSKYQDNHEDIVKLGKVMQVYINGLGVEDIKEINVNSEVIYVSDPTNNLDSQKVTVDATYYGK